MRVFMLGWEFPPFISGGLGTACYGLTRAMSQLDVEATFVLPRIVDGKYSTHVNMLSPGSLKHGFRTTGSDEATPFLKVDELTNVIFHTISSPLQPYETRNVYQQRFEEHFGQKLRIPRRNSGTASQFVAEPDREKASYRGDMYAEVHRYAGVAGELASNERFDVVHAHDWMTYPAGTAVAEMSGRPLIVHVHSTEFDRSGENVNQMIYDIERRGMHSADRIIAVSHFTRDIIVRRYGISGEKVRVVHNGVERNNDSGSTESGVKEGEKNRLVFRPNYNAEGAGIFPQSSPKSC